MNLIFFYVIHENVQRSKNKFIVLLYSDTYNARKHEGYLLHASLFHSELLRKDKKLKKRREKTGYDKDDV